MKREINYFIRKIKVLYFILKENPISFYKLYNLFLAHLSYILRLKKIRSLPFYNIIEPTNYCNLHCPACPTGNNSLKRKKGFLTFQNFKKIMDDIGDYTLNLLLYNLGEPLLNKDIYKMIKYAKTKRPIRVVISTNATTIKTKKDAQKLIDSGLDHLIISLDGATQKTLNKYRVGANLKQIKQAIKLIVDLKKELKTTKPLIEIQFIVMRHNEQEIPAIKKIAKETGVDILSLKTFNANLYGKAKKGQANKFLKFIPKNKIFTRYQIKGKRLSLTEQKLYRCNRPYYGVTINWDGDVVACCYDYEGFYNFGNVFKKSIKEIWHSEKYNNFRKQLLKNRKKMPICRECLGTINTGIKIKMH